LPLELDELDIPLLVELVDVLEDDPPPDPPAPLDELELLPSPDELLELPELLVPFVVLVPVSSVHPKTMSAHEATKTPIAQS
jgi:hypothetical protein